ncbi:MAG: M28 family peptidase [Deltaproteobacteria bacterium]|nr:MAG: M28 family peptidase [Deltaproteobacteria bacterium]
MRRALLGLVAALFLVLPSPGARAEGNATPKLDGEIKGLIDRIDPARIQTNIEKLATFQNRNACSQNLAPNPGVDNGTKGILASQDWVKAQFAANKGLKVAFASYFHANCPTSLTQNVVAWLPGKKHPERLVVIGGHLDSRSFGVLDTDPTTANLLSIAGAQSGTRTQENAPAGDDAGAQTTLVLEAARALSRGSFDNTIVFISFSGEEQGLFGSADPAVPGRLAEITGIPNAKVVAMLNNDISGGDNLANTGDDFSAFRLYSAGTPRERGSRAPDGTTDNTSPARGLMRFIATFGVPFVDGFSMRPVLREDRPGRGSDQTSFINNGVPAVRFIESHECSSSPVDNKGCTIGADGLCTAANLSPFAALPRTDPRHNCLHTNFVCAPTDSPLSSCTGTSTVIPKTRVCANDDERAHGIDLPATFGSQKFLNEGCVDDTPGIANPFHNFQRQHVPNDRPENPTADYEARIAKVMSATLASLARAPNAPVDFAAAGNATSGVRVTFNAAPGDKVEKFIVAARATNENFHRGRVRVEGTNAFVTPAQLGFAPGEPFFISVSALGDGNHESLFAYPEFRCDATACVIPAGALAITASK